MEGPPATPSRSTAVRRTAALFAGGVMLVAAAACGSGSDKGTSSKTVAKKEAGVLGVNLRVINRGPENMYIVICHPGGCKPGRRLRTGDVEDMSASSVSGRFFYERPGVPAQSVRFEAENPAIGKPWITARPEGGNGGIEWNFSEGEYTSLCYYIPGVGRVSGKRDTDIDGYKRLVLEPTSEGTCDRDWGPLR